jgi:hypothetical protein
MASCLSSPTGRVFRAGFGLDGFYTLTRRSACLSCTTLQCALLNSLSPPRGRIGEDAVSTYVTLAQSLMRNSAKRGKDSVASAEACLAYVYQDELHASNLHTASAISDEKQAPSVTSTGRALPALSPIDTQPSFKNQGLCPAEEPNRIDGYLSESRWKSGWTNANLPPISGSSRRRPRGFGHSSNARGSSALSLAAASTCVRKTKRESSN